MKKIKQNISNIIILLFILLGIYALFFGIFTIKNNYDWSIKIIFFSSSIIFFFIFISFLSKKLKDIFVTILTTTYFAFLFVLNLFWNLFSIQFSAAKDLIVDIPFIDSPILSVKEINYALSKMNSSLLVLLFFIWEIRWFHIRNIILNSSTYLIKKIEISS